MRYCIFLYLICLQVTSVFGQADTAILDNIEDIEANQFFYKNEKKSAIDWAELEEKQWLDLSKWKQELKWKEKIGNWRLYNQEMEMVEPVGYLLRCVGQCRIHRGTRKEIFSPRFRSKILERDDFETFSDSYAFIYLLNGTMLRLAPNTSISLNEFNINKHGSFLYARVNHGQILSIPRVDEPFTVQSMRETDIIFYPLSCHKAHVSVDETKRFSDDDLYEYTLLKRKHEKKYSYLNNFIEKNKITVPEQKHTTLFTSANGNVLSTNTVLDFIVLQNSTSYIRSRSGEGLYYDKSPEFAVSHFYSHNSVEEEDIRETSEELESGKWYEVKDERRELLGYPEGQKRFYMPSLVSRRMPSIFIARELFIRKYSQFLFEPSMTKRLMATKYSLRLWDSWDSEGDSDLSLNFLLGYSKMVELKNFDEKKKLFKRIGSRKETITVGHYDESYYNTALRLYLFAQKGRHSFFDLKTGVLNSTKKPFWKIITKQYE